MTDSTRRRARVLVTAGALGLIVLGACSPKRDWSTASPDDLRGRFLLSEAHSDGDDEEVEESESDRYVEFGDDVRLADGCDEHTGSFTFDGGRLELDDPFASPAAAPCPEEESKVAAGVMHAFNSGPKLSVDPDGHLRVQGSDGELEYIFEKAE